MQSAIEQFYEKCRAIHDLQEIQQLLEWDMEVMMPRKGVDQRGNHQAALATVMHAKLTEPAFPGSRVEPTLGLQEIRHSAVGGRRCRRVPDRGSCSSLQLHASRTDDPAGTVCRRAMQTRCQRGPVSVSQGLRGRHASASGRCPES